MSRHQRLPVIGSAETRRLLAECHPDTPLPEALASSGCLLSQPLGADLAALPLRAIQPDWIDVTTVRPDIPVFSPAQAGLPAPVMPEGRQQQAEASAVQQADDPAAVWPVPTRRPAELSAETATQIAYGQAVDEVAAFLRADLSVLVICEKAVVRYLAEHIVQYGRARAPHHPGIPRWRDQH